jgi:6-pyruvoyl-tetrahydropterin synthase
MLPPGRSITLTVTHNMEVAHRLLNLPGKCQNIHGHSMYVTLSICAEVDENGYALGPDGTVLDFGGLKKVFRKYIDEQWDHHLHLNERDPWASGLTMRALYEDGMPRFDRLPGLIVHEGDPSTENIAWWIKDYMETELQMPVSVRIEETGTNGVEAL